MSRHTFEPEIAAKVGLNAAVIYQNIVWWCERNAVKGRNVHGGNAWTFNSVTSFEKLFPYLTVKQIRTALDRLEESGLLEVGNFNADARDRTKWYACARDTEAFARSVSLHLPEKAERLAREGEPLPDEKPVGKQEPLTPKGEPSLFSENEENETQDSAQTPDRFEEFWKAYPKKAGKPAARKAWAKAIKRETPANIIAAATEYAAWLTNAPPGEFRPYPKYPQGWLNEDRWEQFTGGEDFSKMALSANQESQLSGGFCPPSMKNPDGTPNAAARYWLGVYGYRGAAE